MSLKIPFTGRVDSQGMHEWISFLNDSLETAKLVPLDELTEAEQHSAELVVVANPDPQELNRLPNLKWVQSLWAGVERLLAEYDNETVKIVRLVDPQLSKTMAEAVLVWTFYLHRSMPAYIAQQQNADWKQLDLKLPQDQTVGILGLGALGRVAAQRLVANEFNVIGWSRTAADVAGVQTYQGTDQLHEVLAQSDILVILLPLSEQTKGLLNRVRIAEMKTGASVINFGRGPIIDDDALIEALDAGALTHAVLDVFAVEPLPRNDRYWRHPSVTVLPHCSAPTNKKTGAAIAAANIDKFLKDGVIPKGVDRALGY